MNTEVKNGWWAKSANGRTAILYLLSSVLLFSVFIFYPMLRTIYLSFYLTDQSGKAVLNVGFDNYAYLLQSPEFLNSMKATGLFVLYTVPIGIIIALFLALLANEKLKGIGFFERSIHRQWVFQSQHLQSSGYSFFTQVSACLIDY